MLNQYHIVHSRRNRWSVLSNPSFGSTNIGTKLLTVALQGHFALSFIILNSFLMIVFNSIYDMWKSKEGKLIGLNLGGAESG